MSLPGSHTVESGSHGSRSSWPNGSPEPRARLPLSSLEWSHASTSVTVSWSRSGPTTNLLTPRNVAPADYANALERLHAGMRTLDVTTPHYTDRVAEAQRLVASRDHTPGLTDPDRELLGRTLRIRRRSISHLAAIEQLLHGEPHPGNVLSTKNGMLFIDLETCCRGPVEFDLAHVPEEVSECYPDVDQELLLECRILVLAMVAAWRWEPDDRLPDGRRAARELLSALREGPPWPVLDAVMRRQGAP